MIKRVLVTGANGQLAQTLKALFIQNIDAIVFTFASKEELDITQAQGLKTYFQNHQFDYCVNCAAYTNVEQAEEFSDLAYKINALAVKNLADACVSNGIILIQISTDYVFNGEKKTPYLENDLTNPINEYGRSKRDGEIFIEKTGTNYFIIRTSWLYSKYGKNFVKTIIEKIKLNSQLEITTQQTGTPTSCNDLAGFIYYIINTGNKNFGIYNYSATGETTWYDFALEIAAFFPDYNLSSIKASETYRSKAKRPKYSVLDNSKANRLLGKLSYWKDSLKVVLEELSFE